MGILVLVLSLFTVAFPWSFIAGKNSDSGCEVVQLYSWIDQYCYSKNCPDSASSLCDMANKINWHDNCVFNAATADAKNDCDTRKTTFEVALGLSAVSTFCSLFVALGFCIRCCSTSHKRRNLLHVVMNFVALILLGGALAYFAVKVPATNSAVFSNENDNRFWGSESVLNASYSWGPAGWIAGVFTGVVMLISLCMSCQRSGDEIELGTYYSVGEHGEGSYGRTSNTHNFTHTSASTNYAGVSAASTSYVGTAH